MANTNEPLCNRLADAALRLAKQRVREDVVFYNAVDRVFWGKLWSDLQIEMIEILKQENESNA